MFTAIKAAFAGMNPKLLMAAGILILGLLASIGLLGKMVLSLQEENGALKQTAAQQKRTIKDLNLQIKDLQDEKRKVDA